VTCWSGSTRRCLRLGGARADAFDDSERAMVRAAVTPLLAPLLPCGFIMALAEHQQGNELAAIRYFEHSRSAAARPAGHVRR